VANKPKPDAEEYARRTLWHICGIRAGVSSLNARLAELFANETGDDVLEVQRRWKAQCDALHEKLYLEVTGEVGLPPVKPHQEQGEGD